MSAPSLPPLPLSPNLPSADSFPALADELAPPPADVDDPAPSPVEPTPADPTPEPTPASPKRAGKPPDTAMTLVNAPPFDPTPPPVPTAIPLPPATEPTALTDEPEEEKIVGPGSGPLVSVELLLLSGKRVRWDFGQGADVKAVREWVWERWPQEWRNGDEPVPASADALRLLYLGRFLTDKETLASVGIQPSQTTIIHLQVRTLVRDGYDEDPLKPAKSDGGTCGCCTVS